MSSMEAIDPTENPYVAVVSRKYRNLKKKLDKIVKIEAQQKAGKAIIEEQLILLAGKSAVEKALADVESIKTQLEEVAKEQALLVLSAKLLVPSTQNIQTETDTATDKETVSSSTQSELQSSTDASNQTLPLETETVTVSTPLVPPAQPYIQLLTPPAPVDPNFLIEHVQDQILRLLKTLHVCSRYTSTTGRPLPPDIDYFGMSLLGKTSITGFQETLLQSVRYGRLYLDVSID
eukprot:gene8533-17600_t